MILTNITCEVYALLFLPKFQLAMTKFVFAIIINYFKSSFYILSSLYVKFWLLSCRWAILAVNYSVGEPFCQRAVLPAIHPNDKLSCRGFVLLADCLIVELCGRRTLCRSTVCWDMSVGEARQSRDISIVINLLRSPSINTSLFLCTLDRKKIHNSQPNEVTIVRFTMTAVLKRHSTNHTFTKTLMVIPISPVIQGGRTDHIKVWMICEIQHHHI